MSRWRIEGTLTTCSPLHIGSGEISRDRAIARRRRAGDPESLSPQAVGVATIAVDVAEKPLLPATALKGALRAWLNRRSMPNEKVGEVFGTASKDTASKAGLIRLRDSRYVEHAVDHLPAYWDESRLTGVATSVCIDDSRRAAEDRKLFHEEVVPPGVAFRVVVDGEGKPDLAAPLVLKALEGFNDHQDAITLGAGGPAWGSMEWRPALPCLVTLGDEDIAGWLDKPAGLPLPKSLACPVEIALDLPQVSTDTQRILELSLRLRFHGRFLVNDPSQTHAAAQELSSAAAKPPDFAPLRDRSGRPFLPSSSFLGALRARTEMILRTIHGDEGACREGLAAGPCSPVKRHADLTRLCPACRLFGTSGWKAPLTPLDFHATANTRPREQTQDFLRIDRFTGGGANRLKFDGRAAVEPIFLGKVRIDLLSLTRAGVSTWALGLLALALRDMAEGEVPVGFGAGKGYGRMTLEVLGVSGPGEAIWETFAGNASYPAHIVREFSSLPSIGLETVLGKALDAWIRDIPKRPAAGGRKLGEAAR